VSVVKFCSFLFTLIMAFPFYCISVYSCLFSQLEDNGYLWCVLRVVKNMFWYLRYCRRYFGVCFIGSVGRFAAV
jgi:hypothetical protein